MIPQTQIYEFEEPSLARADEASLRATGMLREVRALQCIAQFFLVAAAATGLFWVIN